MFVTFSALADEKGEKRLDIISRYYASLGSYAVDFLLRAEGSEQRGKLVVAGNNSYMSVAGVEVYVVDELRYEVRSATKEVVIDNADLYEKDLLNPMTGFTKVRADYNIEECTVDGSIALRLTPKQSGETIYIITSDGISISKVRYVAGDSRVEMTIEKCQKGGGAVPTFSKDRYKGYELIDFR